MDLFYEAFLLLESLSHRFFFMKIAPSLKIILLCSTEKKEVMQATTWRWKNDDRIFIF